MMNKKLIGIAVAFAISIASFIPVYAAGETLKDPAAKQAKIEARQTKQAQRLDKLKEKAVKLGISIDGLSLEEAKAKLIEAAQAKMQVRAEKLGINIEGLSKEDAKTKIKAAADTKKLEITKKLQLRAEKLGVDISGLSNKEARLKIQEARAQKQAEKTSKSGSI